MTVSEQQLSRDYTTWRTGFNNFRKSGQVVGGDSPTRFALGLIYDLQEQLAAATARLDALESE